MSVTQPLEKSYENAWEGVIQKLEVSLGQSIYKSWLKPLTFTKISDNNLYLSAPSAFIKDWVSINYKETILQFMKDVCPEVKEIIFEVNNTPSNNSSSSSPTTHHTKEKPFKSERKDLEDANSHNYVNDNDELEGQLDPRFTFENFVVGRPNELAHAAARRVAESTTVPFNPLFLYGGVGLGKTHLMHAIAWDIKKKQPNRKVAYISAEKFMYAFVKALRFKDTMAFKDQFRNVDVLMIDDFQFIAGKDSTQEEFFHTFNALVDKNHQVIISADKSPSDLEGIQDRMKSRLGWGLVADLHPTTYELRLGILEAKCENHKVQIPKNVLEFLAHKIVSNVRELEGALNRLVAYSTFVGREINLECTQEVLQDLLRANDRRVTIEEIQKSVAQHYNIRISDMHSIRRARAVARPRQIAMFLSKQLTTKSLPEIGRMFGGRDHTTVLHAIKKIEELKQSDKNVSEDILLLTRTLQNQTF